MKSLLMGLTALLATLSLIAASCGEASDDGTVTGNPAPPTTTASPPSPTPEPPTTTAPSPPSPVSDEPVRMARANWSSGYFQAALYYELLGLLGYTVTDPADQELAPSLAYLSMAQDDVDFWANTWDPLHDNWFQNELPDGSIVGDHISKVGKMMAGGALQGFLVTKSFAEEYGIATLDDLDNNPDALAEYDSYDKNPGDGVADIFGCEEAWTCDDAIDLVIAFSGFENINQIKAGYDAMFAEARAKVDRDEPVVVFTWTPTAYLAHLRPGDNVVWLGVEDVLDDSNPLGLEGGEELDQRPGVAGFGADLCPSADTLGECRIGFKVADLRVTARNDFLANNPPAAKLFEIVTLNAVDVTLQILDQSENEADPTDLALQWISDNQAQVDAWLEEARAAN